MSSEPLFSIRYSEPALVELMYNLGIQNPFPRGLR